MTDARMWIGALFIFGYYAIVVILAFQGVPEKNGNLINNAMLQLGPPVGIIIGALFRTDKADEQRASNTGKALEAITATANASTASAGPSDPNAIRAGDQVEINRTEPTP